MKTRFPLAWMFPLLIVLVGCSAPSKYKNDPRAAVVGPDFLDYIDQYPMDRDTQYSYPDFGVVDARPLEIPSSGSSFPQNVSALMIQTPKPAPSVLENEGKGWAKLEHDGIPF